MHLFITISCLIMLSACSSEQKIAQIDWNTLRYSSQSPSAGSCSDNISHCPEGSHESMAHDHGHSHHSHGHK